MSLWFLKDSQVRYSWTSDNETGHTVSGKGSSLLILQFSSYCSYLGYRPECHGWKVRTTSWDSVCQQILTKGRLPVVCSLIRSLGDFPLNNNRSRPNPQFRDWWQPGNSTCTILINIICWLYIECDSQITKRDWQIFKLKTDNDCTVWMVFYLLLCYYDHHNNNYS